MALPGGHGAHAWHRWTDREHVWHPRTDQEHTCGTARWAWSTRVAPMDRPGTNAWHRWTGREHTYGTDGQTGSTHGTDGQGAHAWDPWTDQEHTHGTDGQAGTVTEKRSFGNRTTCVALTDRPGAHVWHCRVGTERIYGADGQGPHAWHPGTDREHTRGTTSNTAHACDCRGETQSPGCRLGRAAPSRPPPRAGCDLPPPQTPRRPRSGTVA